MRFLFANAAKCEPDKQGRFLIPAELRAVRRVFQQEVTFIGQGGHAEIWDSEAYDELEQPDADAGESGGGHGGAWLLMEFSHRSVLLNECIDALNIQPGRDLSGRDARRRGAFTARSAGA